MNDTAENEVEEVAADRRLDPELRVMGQMLRSLRELDEPARARVVAWLSSRFMEDSMRG